MLEKDEIRGAYRFAEGASDKELLEVIHRHKILDDILSKGSDAAKDNRKLLNIYAEELDARQRIKLRAWLRKQAQK